MPQPPNVPRDVSELESGAVKPELRDFAIADLFKVLRSEFASLAAGKGLKLRVESCAASGYGDPALIEQVVRELLARAVNCTPHGRVTLRCRSEQGVVFLEVEHSGSAAAAGEFSSVQRLVELLNLRLDVTAETGGPSVFSLKVPRGRSAPRAARTPVAAARAAHAGEIRVLLVEDDARVREATSMLLRVEGYGVTAVASLAEAERSTREGGAPDLLISDYRLANGELGTQVIAALRRSLGADLKAVLVTGDTSAALKDKELSSDPNLRILGKPYRVEQLVQLLATLLTG
jgi:two-component system, sensor histidine kinase